MSRARDLADGTFTGTITADGLTVTQTGSTTATIGATGTSGDNDGTLIINNGGTGDGMLRFDYETNTDRARIGVTTSSQDLVVYTAGSEKARILSGGGITFNGDTAAANALNDYEEGTWTPAFTYSVSTTGLSITYANQTGYYTRIGNIVHYTCDVRITSFTKGSASGNLQLEGFPFASKNQSNYGRPNTVPNLYQWPYTSTDGFIPMFGMFQDGAAKGDFSLMRPNNTSINLDDPDGDSMLFLTGWYYAT